MTESTRPKRVVIVDADNPMEEIRGEFFWREDHERAVALARESAYQDGYRDGYDAGSRMGRSKVILRYRRRGIRSALLVVIILAGIVGFVSPVIRSLIG